MSDSKSQSETANPMQVFLSPGMRSHLTRTADWLAILLVASLPWSTSATGILAVLWLGTVLPLLDFHAVRREALTLAGGLPVVLWIFAAGGMLWADVSWTARIDGLSGFHKLLFVPLLLTWFRGSVIGRSLLCSFLISCAVLLIASILSLFFPAFLPAGKMPGVPVKDYISQAAMFTVSALILIYVATDAWRIKKFALAGMLMFAAIVFLIDIIFFATSRTALVTLPLLFILLGFAQGWRVAASSMLALAILAGIAMTSPSTMRGRVASFGEEISEYGHEAASTSAGERLEFWKKSVSFIAAAPLIGHGTGSIEEQYRRSAGPSGVGALIARNPHNQTFAVAIQIGVVGAFILWALWASHFLLFFGGTGLAAWTGLLICAQNVVGSLFNSHLSDFTHGWLYVIGIGVAGGIVRAGNAGGRKSGGYQRR